MSETHPKAIERQVYGPTEATCKTCKFWLRSAHGHVHGGDDQDPDEDYLRECRVDGPKLLPGHESMHEIKRTDGSEVDVPDGDFGLWPLTFDINDCGRYQRAAWATTSRPVVTNATRPCADRRPLEPSS